MDHFPQQTLDEIREIVAGWRKEIDDDILEPDGTGYAIEQLVEKFEKLDEHLSDAGPLPVDWDR